METKVGQITNGPDTPEQKTVLQEWLEHHGFGSWSELEDAVERNEVMVNIALAKHGRWWYPDYSATYRIVDRREARKHFKEEDYWEWKELGFHAWRPEP